MAPSQALSCFFCLCALPHLCRSPPTGYDWPSGIRPEFVSELRKPAGVRIPYNLYAKTYSLIDRPEYSYTCTYRHGRAAGVVQYQEDSSWQYYAYSVCK